MTYDDDDDEQDFLPARRERSAGIASLFARPLSQRARRSNELRGRDRNPIEFTPPDAAVPEINVSAGIDAILAASGGAFISYDDDAT